MVWFERHQHMTPFTALVPDVEHRRPCLSGRVGVQGHLDETSTEDPPVVKFRGELLERLIGVPAMQQRTLPAPHEPAQHQLVVLTLAHGIAESFGAGIDSIY
jgi:hypothetical protein